jgi:hypoxanthine phosphoribosyltransferase
MYKHKELISEKHIDERLSQLAQQLNKDYEGNELDVICILKGSIIFAADLVRRLTVPVRLHFLQVSSYGEDVESSGTITLRFSSVTEDLLGRNVLIVEDILDTGITMDYLLKQLREENPESLKVCVLVDKPSRRKVGVRADYVGFEIEDHFVIGYGLDYQELGRNLRYIAVLDPSEYRNSG